MADEATGAERGGQIIQDLAIAGDHEHLSRRVGECRAAVEDQTPAVTEERVHAARAQPRMRVAVPAPDRAMLGVMRQRRVGQQFGRAAQLRVKAEMRGPGPGISLEPAVEDESRGGIVRDPRRCGDAIVTVDLERWDQTRAS
jgi:hypothetical protein